MSFEVALTVPATHYGREDKGRYLLDWSELGKCRRW